MKSGPRVWLLVPAAALLAACGGLPVHVPSGTPDEAAWQTRQRALARLDAWELEGRVGIVNGEDSGSGSMDWTQRGAMLSFDFYAPLGAGALHIEGDAAGLRVRSSRGDDFVTTDPEEDVARRLKVPLPVLSMRYWMLGLPDPADPYEKRVDSRGELVMLKQRGWRVEYQEYAEVQGYTLPVLLTLEEGDIRIKVAVNQWTLSSAALPAVP
jgi:outer membrane lipoprotein LolB